MRARRVMDGEKEEQYAFAYFLDDEDKDDISVYIVLEWVLEDKPYNIGGGVIKANARMGWFRDAYDALKRRREYGDVSDHSLLTEEEAQACLDPMGLRLEDAKRDLIELYVQGNGHEPVILPVDPKFRQRRDTAREDMGLPKKS